MPVMFKYLVVSRVSFRTTMLRCTILCTFVCGKLDKVFQVSLACIVAGSKVIKRCMQKDISNVKTRGDLIACVLDC